MKKTVFCLSCIFLITGAFSGAEPTGLTALGERAWKESAQPLRPGEPGKRPFWNAHAWRFIYAPAFDFGEVPDAEAYRFTIRQGSGSETLQFVAAHPWAALTPVWEELPVGSCHLLVEGLDAEGRAVGKAGERRFYRAAPFNGIYHEPVLPYDDSARLALESVLNKDYIQYWLKHGKPDPGYGWYRYPSKIYSAVIVGAVTQSRLTKDADETKAYLALARIVADELMRISFPSDAVLPHFPPTYHGYPEIFARKSNEHMFYDRSMIIQGADAGHAYLDLHEATGEERFLDAAKRIAETYLATQLENGSWYLYVNNRTGEPVAPNIAIPTAMVNYFNRLRTEYGVEGLDAAAGRAVAWIMENPVRTFDWHGQFEDIAAHPPYENLSREQACDLANYLFQNASDKPESLALALELVRFAEDQFVIWENPEPQPEDGKAPGALPQNWITPCVQEQYAYWRPIARSAGIMIDTYWNAFVATGDSLHLAKAKSIANAFTVVQAEHDGDYPTHFTAHKMNFWLNNAIYPAKVMMTFEKNLESIE